MLLFAIYKQNVNILRLSRIRLRIKEKPTSGFISQRHSKLVYAYRRAHVLGLLILSFGGIVLEHTGSQKASIHRSKQIEKKTRSIQRMQTPPRLLPLTQWCDLDLSSRSRKLLSYHQMLLIELYLGTRYDVYEFNTLRYITICLF